MKAVSSQQNKLTLAQNGAAGPPLQCSALHPITGEPCRYWLPGHPNQHCAVFESAPGQTTFSEWPVAPVVTVAALPFRIVPAWQKRLMVAGAVALVVGAMLVLYWLAQAQGVID